MIDANEGGRRSIISHAGEKPRLRKIIDTQRKGGKIVTLNNQAQKHEVENWKDFNRQLYVPEVTKKELQEQMTSEYLERMAEQDRLLIEKEEEIAQLKAQLEAQTQTQFKGQDSDI